ncbi:MAG: hypothetical protein ACI8TP_004375 [Acidimicrobiales bacterium]|jgi:hypothetical protein
MADRAEYIESMRPFFASGGTIEIAQILGVRGERLALTRIEMNYGDENVSPVLVIERATPRDEIDRFIVFDADDLRRARLELDELYREELAETIHRNDAWRSYESMGNALANADFEALNTKLSHEFLRVDHRSGFSLPPADRDEWVNSMRTLVDISGDQVIASWWPIETRGDHLILVQTSLIRSGGQITDHLALIRTNRQGLMNTLLVFDADDLAAALLKLDRLQRDELGPSNAANQSDPTIANTASTIWASRFGTAVNANDWATAGPMLSDALQFEVHRRTANEVGGGKADFQAQANSWTDIRMTSENTPIAVRDEHLVLLETEQHIDGRFNVLIYSVIEVNESGVATYLGVWDEDDLQLANDESVNRRWFATLNSSQRAQATFLVAFGEAIVHADLDWMERHIAPGFQSNDHRPAGLGDRDRATFMAMVAQRPTTVGDGVFVLGEVLRSDAEWVVASMDLRTQPPSGGGYVSEQVVTATQFGRNQFLRVDIYPIERPQQALAALAETLRNREPVLAAAGPQNLATETGLRLAEAGYGQRDWATVEALSHEGPQLRGP